MISILKRQIGIRKRDMFRDFVYLHRFAHSLTSICVLSKCILLTMTLIVFSRCVKYLRSGFTDAVPR